MKKILALALGLGLLLAAGPALAGWHAVSDKTVKGLQFCESVAYDPVGKTLYVSSFGSALAPQKKDGAGYLSKVDLSGKVLAQRMVLPQGVVLHKPKGVWCDGHTLWTTDIDKVWAFDLASNTARSVDLPGVTFANDVAAHNGVLYVSGSDTGKILAIVPADLKSPAPEVKEVFQIKDERTNGVWMPPSGKLLFCTYTSSGKPGGIYQMAGPAKAREVAPGLGALDGLAMLSDGTLLFTDWSKGALFALGTDGQTSRLAGGFKGPADFAVVPSGKGYLVVAPDLVTGDLRFVTISQ